MVRRWGLVALAAAVACSDASTPPLAPPPPVANDTLPPVVLREFRGLWVATVANIDWPSASRLPAAQQQQELLAILDLARSLHLTSVILQVRAAGDALYASSHEPWSASLNGAGTDPGYDPLAFAIREAHRRGLELHAWFNPFRAGNASDTARHAPQHFSRRRPDLARVVRGSLWFDPGEPEVQDHTMRVILDVVARYDIDAVHLDDFFYPYPTSGTTIPVPFPDSVSYAKYVAQAGAGALSREDWRRDNITRFVTRLYRDVHSARPTLPVGISPFGIWRPGNPAGVVGLDAWRDIYADSRLWLERGLVDYLAPQLYWSIASTGQSFPALLDWWRTNNLQRRHLWPGLAVYRVADGSSSAFPATEISAQVQLVRQRAEAVLGAGVLLYNTTSLRLDRGGVASLLRTERFTRPALPPPYPWLDASTPAAPTLTVDATTIRLASAQPPRWWFVRQRQPGNTWTDRLLPADSTTIPRLAGSDRVQAAALNRSGGISGFARWP